MRKSSFNTLWGRIWNGREPFSLRLSRGDKYTKTGNYNPGRWTAQQTFRTRSFVGDSLCSGIPLLARFFRTHFFILLILWWMLISAPVSPPLVPKFGAPGPILPTTEFQSPSNGAARIIYNLLPNNSGTKWHGGILFIPWILSPSTLKRPIPSDGSSYHSHVDSFCRYWWSTCHASRMVTDLRVNERTKTLPSPNSIVLLAGGWERSEQINRVRLDTLQRTK